MQVVRMSVEDPGKRWRERLRSFVVEGGRHRRVWNGVCGPLRQGKREWSHGTRSTVDDFRYEATHVDHFYWRRTVSPGVPWVIYDPETRTRKKSLGTRSGTVYEIWGVKVDRENGGDPLSDEVCVRE